MRATKKKRNLRARRLMRFMRLLQKLKKEHALMIYHFKDKIF